MKLKFTLLGISFLLFSSALFSQALNTFVVTEPAEIAGAYPMTVATFGGPFTNTSGTASFINDGTDPVTNACEDSVADVGFNWGIADRGECEFSTKALFMQNANANVAIICNNVDGTIVPGPGTVVDASLVTIPVVALSLQTCQTLRSIGEDVQISAFVEARCGVGEFGPEYIWGTNPGEGDFDGGLGDWTIQNESPNGNGWLFANDGRLDRGGSNCNGYASFPTDGYFFDGLNGGCQDADGAEFDVFTTSCDGTLTSPNIAITDPGSIDNLVCEFNHLYDFFFDGVTNLAVSWDDGVTWPDTFNVSAGGDSGAVPTSPFYPMPDEPCVVFGGSVFVEYFQTKRIPITTFNGQENIRLQFIHVGNLYECTIDDVALLNLADYHDMELGQQFVSYAPAVEMPLSQAQEVALHVDVINVGNTAVNAVVEATAITEDGTQVFEATNGAYGSQPGGCFLNQNISFPEFYTPTELGQHTVLMTNVTPDDARINGDDSVGFVFNMTENTWLTTPDPRRFASGERWDLFTNFNAGPAESFDANWAVAYPFFTPAGGGHFLNTVRFGIQARPTNSGNIFAYVLQWTPGDLSFPDGGRGAAAGEPANPANYNFHPDETEVVGIVGEVFGFPSTRIPISPNVTDINNNPVNFEDITLTMVAADDATGAPITNNNGEFQPIALEDDSYYILVFAIAPTSQVPVDIIGESTSDRDVIYHDASNFAYANAGRFTRPNAHFTPLFDGFGYDDVVSIPWSGTATEWGPNTPWIEMDINPVALVTSSTEDINPEVAQGISIFPNPVSDRLTINVDLTEVSSTVQFDLMNISGELLRSDTYNDVQKGAFNMNVADLISGVYTLNVRTEAGFTAKKVIIQK